MRRRSSRPVAFMTFAGVLLASARLFAATPAGWYGVSLNVEIEALGGTIQAATIRDTLPNSPASEQHLSPGDRLIEIEGQRVAGATLQTLHALIDKGVGEPLRLRLQRPSGAFYCAVLIAAPDPD